MSAVERRDPGHDEPLRDGDDGCVDAEKGSTEDASFGQPLVLVRLETIAHEPLDVLDDGRRKLVLASRSRLSRPPLVSPTVTSSS